MDAPGATTGNRDSEKSISEQHDTLARSRSPSDTHPNGHDRRHQDSDNGSEGSGATEDQSSDDEDDEDDEPRLKYAYLTKHLGSIYRNGDATSTFLVAGDKMVRTRTGSRTTRLIRTLRLLVPIMVSS